MSEDFTPVEINTQGLDADLNSNFSGLQAEIEAENARATAAEETLTLNLNAFETATQSALSVKADLGGNATQRFKVADGVDATDAVSKEQLDTVSGAVSHTIAAGTVLNVPSQYADIPSALAYLNGKTLLGNVTIQIEDGTYTYTSPVTITHPQSDLITMQGNTSNRSAVTLNFTNCNGFQTNYGRRISLNSLTVNGNRSNSAMGILCYGYGVFKNVVISNFYEGILLRNGYIDLNTCSVISNITSGIHIYGGAYCGLVNCSLSYNTYGALVENSSFMDANTSITVSNNTYGLQVDTCSSIAINNTSTISSNTTNAIVANNNSFVSAVGATISGTLSPAANTIGNINSYIQR